MKEEINKNFYFAEYYMKDTVVHSIKPQQKIPFDELKMPTIANFKEMNNFKYTVNQLKIIAKYLKIKLYGNKKELQQRIYSFLFITSKAIHIQRCIRGFITRKYIHMHGPAILLKDRSLCTNISDFITMEPVKDISFHQFFSYKDKDDFIYGFDISSLHNLIMKSTTDIKNPYNRNQLPVRLIKHLDIILRMSKIFKTKIDLSFEDMPPTISTEKAVELRALSLFQHIDSVGNYSNSQWFLSLNRQQTIHFIKELVDIWNYRAQITEQTKRNICPPYGNPFTTLNINYIITEPNLLKVKNNLLNVMEKFVFNGIDHDSKSLGAYYVLGALTLVNNDAAESIPWLFQSFI